ncbi:MAG: hypothetical protein KGR46_02035 [Verrucomicrobia bacterium]|nr:hypothetical protein [Verrucomicrobiota bacterium]
MRLLFICSSLNSGTDGVGDYTRRLTRALRERGHIVYLTSLSEKSGSLKSPEDDEHVLRLTVNLPWKARLDQLNGFLRASHPEWISLQYVPYGFQKKGTPFSLPSRLASTTSGANWHLMFHELWIGITHSSPWRHKLVGFFQRHIARSLVWRLKPKVVHTSNPLYVELLKRAGIKAARLPLFGAIQLDSSELEWMKKCLSEDGITDSNRHEWLLAGMFGSCYPDFPLEKHVERAANRANQSGKKLALLGIGGGVGTGMEWESRIRESFFCDVARHFGRQTEQRVSAFLQSLDLAIPSTPVEFLGKSSAAASMALHGADLDMTYRVDMPEYRDLNLANWRQSDLFWPLERVATEIEKTFAPPQKKLH